jgi:hypothetical protein
MSVDDPLKAIQGQLEAETRSESPLNRFVQPLAEVLKLIPNGTPVAFLAKTAAFFIDRESQARREELLRVLISEMAEANKRLAALEEDPDWQNWLKHDFPNLVLDGLQKAEQVRSEKRVARMGMILGHAYEQGSKLPDDLTEEMVRVAMSLGDEDVQVLAWLCEALRPYFSEQTGRVDHEHANSFWGQTDQHGRTSSAGEPSVPSGFTVGDLMSCCTKLQASGLVIQVQPNPGKVSPATVPYTPLKRGYDFLAYIQGATKSSE